MFKLAAETGNNPECLITESGIGGVSSKWISKITLNNLKYKIKKICSYK